MGQVLGFSHCQEYGSVASTPDSSPPCTDGGIEESELYELQTAREWSDDEDVGDVGYDEDDEDDEGIASSPSIWGTPRQNSSELTFSYIAISEAEAVGTSRHLRDRRRGTSRSSRTPLIRTDTLETLLDPPDVEWDPQTFLSGEEEESVEERTRERDSGGGEGPHHRQTETVSAQPAIQVAEIEPQGGDEGVLTGEMETCRPCSSPLPPHHQSSSQCPQATTPSPLEPESPVTVETISVKLITSAGPRGMPTGDPASGVPAAIGPNTQEQLASEHSALNPSDDTAVWIHIEAMDLIFWKDTERSGMVLTALVVALLSLFQLSIITVVSTLSLAVVCFTISVRIYYLVLHVLSWGDGEHPFKAYLDLDISLRGEQADQCMQKAIVMTLSAIDTLKRLLFVGNLFDSLKFLALVYLVTFLGHLCNGLTLVIIGVIALFSLPLFYRQRQEQVDSILSKIQAQIDNIKDILQRMVQGGVPVPDPAPGGAKEKSE